MAATKLIATYSEMIAGRLSPTEGIKTAFLAISLPVVFCTFLPGAFKSLEIDVDKAKTLAVAFGPFEIIDQRPVEITAHIDAFGTGFVQFR